MPARVSAYWPRRRLTYRNVRVEYIGESSGWEISRSTIFNLPESHVTILIFFYDINYITQLSKSGRNPNSRYHRRDHQSLPRFQVVSLEVSTYVEFYTQHMIVIVGEPSFCH